MFSPLCIYRFGHQTAKNIIVYCRNYSAIRHAIRDNWGHPPDFKQLVTALNGLLKVTKWVIQIIILGLYYQA